MGIISNLYARLFAKIPVRGTFTTPSGEESTPVAVCNDIMGGPFIANDLDDLREIHVERLVKGCKCTVNEYTDVDGITPTRTYLCVNVPSVRLSESGEDISDYWVLDRPEQQDESAIESQYSADYEGLKPPFIPSVITKEAYNAGYGSTADYESGDTSKKIWKSDYDDITHKWVRQRTGTLADWGIPVSVDSGYQEGNYADIRFQWRLKTLGAPSRPSSMVDGVPNNNPFGWSDTPDIPEGEDYNSYILLNDLWRISATKGVYGDLLSEWSEPVQISTDPNLVRYGIDPYNTDYLNDTYWRPYYSPDDKYRASRETVNLPWSVEKISGESGEYIDYVFKEFQNSYEPVPGDKPTTTLGYGINGWKDGVFTAQEGYTLHVSTSRKYSDGTLASDWTLPVRYDGKSTLRAVIVPKDNTGQTFKYATTSGSTTISPEAITLKSKLFEAVSEIEPGLLTSVQWYRGSVDEGTLIPKLPIGDEPNRNPQYGGINDEELTIFPENVSGNQEFSCRVVFRGEDYIDSITIVDVTDGIGYQTVIESSAGFIYKGTESKDFTAYIYENGVDMSESTNVSFEWMLGSTTISTTRTATVTDEDVLGITVLTLVATVAGIAYTRTEALTDVSDGDSVIREYSSLEVIDISSTPNDPANPNGWSPNSTDAIWVIEKIGDADWGVPYRVKGEKGDPNGAFQKTVYRTRASGTTPGWLTERPVANTNPTDNLIPVDWTDNPESDAPTGSEIYGTKATFIKTNTSSVEELVANWGIDPTGWSLPFKVTTFPESGDNGAPGTDGYDGWSPKLAVVSDGSRRVQKLQEWIGGSGAKPGGEGYYIGSSGLVSSISSATDIRGATGPTGPKGNDGVFNSSDFWATSTYKISGSNGSPNYESWDARFRKAKNGMVYYSIRCYRNGGGGRGVQFTLGSGWTGNNMYPQTYYQSASSGGNGVHVTLPGLLFEINNDSPSRYGSTEGASIRRVSGTWKLRIPFQDNCTGNFTGCYPARDSI